MTDLEASAAAFRHQAETILSHYAEAESIASHPPPPADASRSFDAVVGGTTVTLLVGRSPRESAQSLFEESKRVQLKLAGARVALEETERRRSASSPLPPRGAPAIRPPTERHRTRWFEQYRWFISSEGAIVVAGRDAASNDLVVKRHLKEGDIYVHADLHGAASVVVKHPAPEALPLTEATYTEAGQWAVAFSKAWKAGLASGSG